jgi:hypothetical protein
MAYEGMLASTAAINPTEIIPGARASGIVKAGLWAWAAASPAGAATDKVLEQFVANTSASSVKPIGLVYRESIAALPADQEYSTQYNDGQPVPVAKGASFWVKTATAATVGQKAFAVIADGATKTGAAGAAITGAVETDWEVKALQASGAVGDLILISKV